MALRVLHITAGNLFGGVENTLSILAEQSHWDARLERHFAVCFAGRLSEILTRRGANLTILGPVRIRNPLQILRVRSRLRELLRSERFDAVVCHMIWSFLIFGSVVRRQGIPLVFWMHDVASGKHWLEKKARLSKAPDLAIINSRFTAASLPKLFRKPPPHVVIHPPATPVRMITDPADRAAVRLEFGLSASEVVIIQVGRMERYKGHEVHLSALARLREISGWSCWIVGGAQRPHEHEYVSKLETQARESGIAERVRFLGERADVQRLLGAADIFCQPNIRGEPFGVVFSEALYAGLPVVATALGGALEIVDESCGRLVPPGNSEALASTLSDLISRPDLRAKLGQNGPARAKILSDPDRVMEKLQSAIWSISKGRRAEDVVP